MPEATTDSEQVFGFNSEVSYRGANYHVQTENMGTVPSPIINTLVFHKGELVEKTSSTLDLDDDALDAAERLERRVKQQHLETLNRIKRGALTPG